MSVSVTLACHYLIYLDFKPNLVIVWCQSVSAFWSRVNIDFFVPDVFAARDANYNA